MAAQRERKAASKDNLAGGARLAAASNGDRCDIITLAFSAAALAETVRRGGGFEASETSIEKMRGLVSGVTFSRQRVSARAGSVHSHACTLRNFVQYTYHSFPFTLQNMLDLRSRPGKGFAVQLRSLRPVARAIQPMELRGTAIASAGSTSTTWPVAPSTRAQKHA